MTRHKVFSSLVNNKKDNYSLIMTSVLVAVGVNLLSTGIVDIFGFQYSEIIFIVLGILLSLGVIAWNALSKLRALNQTTKFKGFVIYDEDNHKIVDVPEYEISTDMAKYQQCASSENKAFEKLWNKDSISPFRAFDNKFDKKMSDSTTQSGTLFIELLEYCLIEKLSLHLSDYFNDVDDKLKVQEFQKNDIPQVLLSNRFLKLFSEDMINREIFTCRADGYEEDVDNRHVVCAYNFSGGYYHKFDLILPKNSRVTRKGKNEIVIDTPILTLTLTSSFDGFNTVLRSGFNEYYMGFTRHQRASLNDYQFNVEVSVTFKLRSLFLKERTIYYSWIDSFLDTLGEYMGKDRFFERINWDTAYTLIRCANITNKSKVKD